ncbi:hypothetical protein [Streptococcus ovuberis]|uniref:Uncharacterized protein n=1 Tax=Streptococcus ovuberis TaxID=1936207 RepID=A0A7X6MWJ5_9STRE|nr:hypothetical protein [Streptococcus ovuberis]NKZ19705.1 hypothetical protein [Streptococcus ovuberis]
MLKVIFEKFLQKLEKPAIKKELVMGCDIHLWIEGRDKEGNAFGILV